MSSKSEKIRSIVFVAVFAAMLCVVSQIAIPMPSAVPITLQILMVALAGYTLGISKALLSVLLYVSIGAIGLPVFFAVAVICAAFAKTKLAIPLGIVSVLVCHLMGVIQYMLVSKITPWAAFLSASLPYIIKDIALVVVAYFISRKLNKILNKEVAK